MLLTSILYVALAQSLSASAATMQVTVGANNQFTFTPSTITAAAGDTVNFNFVSANHSVVSSDPGTPCQPQTNALFSDYQPVASPSAAATTAKGKKAKKAKNNIVNARQGNMPSFAVPIQNTNPMYIYCSQAQHCQQGMVMVINPPAAGQGTTLNMYASTAAQANSNTGPQGGVNGGTVTNSQATTATTAKGKGKAKAAKAKGKAAAGGAAAGGAAAGGAAAGGAAAGGAGGLAGLLGGKGKGN
ncbi:hypothetical protein K504DRAFT_508715 [Pleomassaria siparia CBS 279.74]|uniref:Cupredoxin n=1 Tax=Pleomassaria siparia CBS 279.74 TaxID=1314801 RepID=A0A6G1JR89_9PLEO|nr:hypothetical protein K504DRAFT_508715 [Pleomassaria siparia CBS 279.74]